LQIVTLFFSLSFFKLNTHKSTYTNKGPEEYLQVYCFQL
jgi:hypothetical protein